MRPVQLQDRDGNVFFSIELNDNGWLFCSWNGEITDDKVVEGGNALAKAVEDTRCPYLINDNRQLEGSWLSAMDWIVSDLEPRLRKAGNRFIAHILSPEFITKFSAVELEARLDQPSFKLFYDLESAENWMQSNMKAE